MIIMHLLKHCNHGNGHVHVAVDLACEQARLGHQVTFVSSGGSYVQLLGDRGVRHITVDGPRGLGGSDLFKILTIVYRLRPAIIHAHMMSSAIFAFIATRIFGGRLVTTVHNSFDSHSFIMKLGDGFVAVSHAEAELLARRGFDSSSKFMIHNGPIGSVRQSFFAHIKDVIPSPCVVTLSGLHDRKRVQDVIHAFSEISALFPKWKLVIIGEGPDEAKLKACAKKLGVEGSVIFFGSSLNPSYLLHQAQIFVSMSHSEPFGLAVVEARSAGCAIIVANAGGMPEVIEGGRAGIIIPPGDVKGLVRELKVLLGDPEVLRKWQLASTLHGNIYSVSKMTEEYLRAYQSIIDRSTLGPMGLRSTISAIRRVLSLFLQK